MNNTCRGKIGRLPKVIQEQVNRRLEAGEKARPLVAIRKLVETSAGGEPDLQTLRAFVHDVVGVRRGDHRTARLQLDRERREIGQ